MKGMAMRVDDDEGDSHTSDDRADLIGLAKLANIKTADEAILVVEAFYPQRQIPQKTFFGLQELFELAPETEPQELQAQRPGKSGMKPA